MFINIYVQILYKNQPSVFCDKYLSAMADLYHTYVYFFKDTTKLFPKQLYHFTFSLAVHEWCSLCIIANIWYYHF